MSVLRSMLLDYRFSLLYIKISSHLQFRKNELMFYLFQNYRKKVEGNDVGAVHVIMKRKYRQYMNRKGGFNRPLDFVA
ncbi:U4/U6.U5 small nuclear ribonucleoprotein [Armadillidium nasatum]|uniref:U4/U6.U5 small nuclear ribonucleoprotein 27 kDa protein n=1 Tax=Armadillidium nasatum TaxID=96803 RepID=A0A5N5TJS9_9CRUS|nr:U4/U6.U5 small nuclear ribonucleoprotein [Armadillidium nasatum]